MILKMIISLNVLLNCGNMTVNKEVTVPPPKVIKTVYTNIPEENNWVTIPKGTKEITIAVEAKNTESVLFWLIPTGTETWWERQLIGYDINENKENKFNQTQKFSLTWKIDRPFLHDYLVVELVGMHEVTGGGSINISME